MINVKEYLDKNFHTIRSTADIKNNGHHNVQGDWVFPSPDNQEFYFDHEANMHLRKNWIGCTSNNETLRIDAVIGGRLVGYYGYLQTYEHIPRGEPDSHGYFARSTDEEIIRYIDGFVEMIKSIQVTGNYTSKNE